MGSFGIWHLLILAGVIFFFFGKNRLPDLGRGFGRFVKGFKEGLNDVDVDSREVKELSDDSTEKATQEKTRKKDHKT